MTRCILAASLSLLATAAFAQAVDCSAFEHESDGSWVVKRATRLVDVKHGVSQSVALSPKIKFSRHANPAMGGVDVYNQLESHCR